MTSVTRMLFRVFAVCDDTCKEAIQWHETRGFSFRKTKSMRTNCLNIACIVHVVDYIDTKQNVPYTLFSSISASKNKKSLKIVFQKQLHSN